MFMEQEFLPDFLELIESLPSLRFLSLCDYSITEITIPADFWNGLKTVCFRDIPQLRYLRINSHSLRNVRICTFELLPSLEEVFIGSDCMSECPVELMQGATKSSSVSVSVNSIMKEFVLKSISLTDT